MALASIMNFYNPEAIILGGGVIEAIDLLFERAVHRARTTALSASAQKQRFYVPNLVISPAWWGCVPGGRGGRIYLPNEE